jgi:hypothetical protein
MMAYYIDDVIKELKALSIDTPRKPKLPDDKLLDKYEAKIGFRFSDDYRKFLKQASDVFVGVLNPLIVTESGDATSELAIALSEAREMGLPNGWLPICEDNGDYYCLIENGNVCFWSHNGATDELWPDLATWIKVVWIEES